MVLGKLPVPKRPTNLDNICAERGPTVLAVGAGGLVFFFSCLSFLSFFSLSGRWPDID